MIYFYSGTPGSGKSLHVAEDIYKYLRNGKNVIANFDINESAVKGYGSPRVGKFTCKENYELSVDYLYHYAAEFHKRNIKGQMIEKQTLLVIDECQLIFNSRSWNQKGRMDWCTFFTQHRKYGFTVILISQFDRLIDRQIRSLIEYEYKHRKINNFKLIGAVLGLLCGGNLFIAVQYWYGVREKIGSRMFRGRRKYYNLYNSYKLFDARTGADDGERKGDPSEHPPTS